MSNETQCYTNNSHGILQAINLYDIYINKLDKRRKVRGVKCENQEEKKVAAMKD